MASIEASIMGPPVTPAPPPPPPPVTTKPILKQTPSKAQQHHILPEKKLPDVRIEREVDRVNVEELLEQIKERDSTIALYKKENHRLQEKSKKVRYFDDPWSKNCEI